MFGAADAGSGTTVMMEVARAIAEKTKSGTEQFSLCQKMEHNDRFSKLNCCYSEKVQWLWLKFCMA